MSGQKTIFEPLAIGNIEEGDFLQEANDALVAMQRQMLAYKKKHGDSSDKATGVLTLTVKVKIEKANSDLFVVTSAISTKVPGRPNKSTMAMATQDQQGLPSLFVRASTGSDIDDPRQAKIFNKHGDAMIDEDDDE